MAAAKVVNLHTLSIAFDSLKHKIVYIAGHLVYKFREPNLDTGEEISSDFLETLNQGGLIMPTYIRTFLCCLHAKLMKSEATERRKKCGAPKMTQYSIF